MECFSIDFGTFLLDVMSFERHIVLYYKNKKVRPMCIWIVCKRQGKYHKSGNFHCQNIYMAAVFHKV